MAERCDVLVVGAGPAGSVAARVCAESGLRVILIEKRQEIGAPVRCGEAIGAEVTRPYIDLDDRWIAARITGFAFCSGTDLRAVVPPTEPTLIVNRKVFDLELARLAARAGADVRARTQAEELIEDARGRVTGARLRGMAGSYAVEAELVIAADGVESQLARWAGLATPVPLADMYVGFEYLAGGLAGRIRPDSCEYHFGPAIAQGGYAWVFPKGDDTANVGLVIAGHRAPAARPREALDAFVARRFGSVSILSVASGGIPVTGGLKRMSAHGLMLVGDAAHHAEPLTGGGINTGMMGADLAAQTAVAALRSGDASAAALSQYDRDWRERFGRPHAALAALRRALARLDDREWADLIAGLAAQPIPLASPGRLILSVLAGHPRLLLSAREFVASGLAAR